MHEVARVEPLPQGPCHDLDGLFGQLQPFGDGCVALSVRKKFKHVQFDVREGFLFRSSCHIYLPSHHGGSRPSAAYTLPTMHAQSSRNFTLLQMLTFIV